ncbi:hypothetical protein [Herbiconiux sp. VKM Ac-2851]|uniref:hypothetical protein n=1 Tax=Herbiconiux sp. VKM Ac-2851 TaxID=2739025 RepID=UPI001565CCC9|nr:hypothetical protein [Herbiconiux sp. VKM Ac-2851]NQX33673.1 hypothetical protein [Herbiconiux sp. VKM Ac-2851]
MLTLAGCSGGAPEAAPAADSPLAPYTDALYGGTSDEELASRNATMQNAAAACMKEQGFPYEPDTSSGISVQADGEGGVEWGSRAFAEQYGYGVVSSPFASAAGDEGTEVVDPNAGYLATLSEGERAAWEAALYGAPVDESTALTEWDWTKAGCLGAAAHEADLAAGAASADPEAQGLIDELNELPERAASADAVVTAERRWSDCLATAGHPGYAHRADPMTDFSDRYSALARPGEPPVDGAAPGSVDQAALDALQEEEIAVAVADLDCAASTHYDDLLAAEQQRLDQEFVDRNRAALDSLVAAHDQR